MLAKLRESGLYRFVFKYQFTKHLVKFSLVGAANTVIDFTIYFSLTRLISWFALHYLIANFLAFITANLFSFLANKFWTFRQHSLSYLRQYAKFLATSLVSLLAVQLTLYLLVSGLGAWDVVAKVVALMVSLVINFSGSKYWAFK